MAFRQRSKGADRHFGGDDSKDIEKEESADAAKECMLPSAAATSAAAFDIHQQQNQSLEEQIERVVKDFHVLERFIVKSFFVVLMCLYGDHAVKKNQENGDCRDVLDLSITFIPWFGIVIYIAFFVKALRKSIHDLKRQYGEPLTEQ